MSQQSFADLGVSKAVVDALSKRGITAPFAVQQLVVGDVLAGRDALVKSPTGSGKTLAFGIPLADRVAAEAPRPAALILAPTRELATQIVDEIHDVAHARALRVTAVYGGVGLHRQAVNAARSHILVATPGRLEDLLARRAFTLDNVRLLVLDEADRMLDMGFRPAVDRIVAACPSDRQTLFFSATLDGLAGDVAAAYTRDAVVREYVPVVDRQAAIEHRFVPVGADRVDALVEQLEGKRDLALVFVRTKRGADRLVKRLAARDVEAIAIHGDKSQGQRERALAQFESFRVDTLIATDVAARGLDVDGISHVINFDLPQDHDTYTHRVGRTGRAGRSGIGITLVGLEDQDEARRIERMVATGSSVEGADGGRPRPKSRPASGRPSSGGNGGGGHARKRRERKPAGATAPPRQYSKSSSGSSSSTSPSGAASSSSRSQRGARGSRPARSGRGASRPA
jgi:superfamily II DNA/RNA helicase